MGTKEAKYDFIGEFHQGVAIVMKNDKFGAIMVGGNEIIPPIYKALSAFENGIATAKYETFEHRIEEIIINLSKQIQVDCGKETLFLPNIYDWGHNYVGEICIVEKDGDIGVIDKEGGIIVALGSYKYVVIINERLIKVAGESIESELRVLGHINLDTMVSDDKEKIVKMKSYTKWGLLDNKGTPVIPCIYDGIDPYDSYLKIRKENLYGIVSAEGVPIAPCIYDKIELFCSFIKAYKNDKFEVFNNLGKKIIEIGQYEYAELGNRCLVVVAKGKKNAAYSTTRNLYTNWGVLDFNGEEVAYCGYSAVSIERGEYILACQTIPIDDIYNGRELEDEDDRNYYNWVKSSENNYNFGLWEIINKEGDIIIDDIEGSEEDARMALDCYLKKSGSDDTECYDISYSKYGGYNSWDDDAINEAFEGNPELTWNVD